MLVLEIFFMKFTNKFSFFHFFHLFFQNFKSQNNIENYRKKTKLEKKKLKKMDNSKKRLAIKSEFQKIGIDSNIMMTEDQFNSAMDTLVSQLPRTLTKKFGFSIFRNPVQYQTKSIQPSAIWITLLLQTSNFFLDYGF